MALKKNILASYVSQLYVILASILVVPLYISYMGVEAYGLVGFFMMLQAWFLILDMGLTPTTARETARFSGGASDAESYRRLLRVLETVFLCVACLSGVGIFVASGVIARDWLHATHLPLSQVTHAIEMMAAIIALRWMAGFYRGTITGAERIVWLAGYNSAIATLRMVGVLPVLIFVSAAPTAFFTYQVCVAAVELVGLAIYAYRLMPRLPRSDPMHWDWKSLKPVLKFSLTIGFTSSVWVAITQSDKLVLSTVLPLAEYGYFSVAVLMASGVLVMSAPISAALLPRLSRLHAEGNSAQFVRIYRQATQLVAVFAGAASITLAVFSEQVLLAWTGDRILAAHVAPVLTLYGLGNGLLAVSAFPYYLQFAKGDLRLHLLGNIVFVVVLVPAIVWAASQYGARGAGYVWLAMNLFFFAGWLPLVHSRLQPGLNWKWYSQDVLVIFVAAGIAGYGMSLAYPEIVNRGAQVVGLGLVGMLTLLSGAAASSGLRARARVYLRQRHRHSGQRL